MKKNIFIEALHFEDVFDRVTFLKKEVPRDVVIQEIVKRNENKSVNYPNSLGSGAYGVVYENERDDQRVYKVGNANSNGGYLTYVRILNLYKNVHFPTLISRELFVNKETGEATFLIEMERLLRYDDVTDGNDCLPAKYQNMNYHTWQSKISEHVTYTVDAYGKWGSEHLDSKIIMPPSYHEAVNIVRAAKASRNSLTGWDLNWSNIMFRPNTLDMVITDPMT